MPQNASGSSSKSWGVHFSMILRGITRGSSTISSLLRPSTWSIIVTTFSFATISIHGCAPTTLYRPWLQSTHKSVHKPTHSQTKTKIESVLTMLEIWPGSTDSKRKLGASLSSSLTRHRYASTGVRWSENMQRKRGMTFPFLEASRNFWALSTEGRISKRWMKH